MVGSRSMQFLEELKKWLVQPESTIAQKSLMLEIAVTKVLEDVRLLMSNISVILVPCPYQAGLLIIDPFLVFILLACSL